MLTVGQLGCYRFLERTSNPPPPNVFLSLTFLFLFTYTVSHKIVFNFLAPQLVHGGNIDFLVFDYLSEITMSLLARAQQKSPVCIKFC